MKPKSSEDLWYTLIHRIRIFNSVTGSEVPELYIPNYPPKKNDLYRARDDMDHIFTEYDIGDEYSFRSYITTRYMMESAAEFEI